MTLIPTRATSGMAHPLLMTATIARLTLVPVMMISFMTDALITTVALGAFMVMDLLDGVVARRLNVDDARRRAVDSVVDHLAIDLCLVAATLHGAMPLPILVGFLLRDAYCGALCLVLLRSKGAVVKVDFPYRLPSYLICAWALAAPFLPVGSREAFALAILMLCACMAVDLTRLVGRIRGDRRVSDRPTLVSAASLRRDSSSARPGGSESSLDAPAVNPVEALA